MLETAGGFRCWTQHEPKVLFGCGAVVFLVIHGRLAPGRRGGRPLLFLLLLLDFRAAVGGIPVEHPLERLVHPRLLLEEAVDLEPVGSAAVARPGLGHAHEEALAESASLAGGPVFLVDDALASVFALPDGRYVAISPTEKRL